MKSKKLLRRVAQLYDIFSPFRRAFLVITLIIVCNQLLSLFVPFFYGRIIDGFIKQRPVKELVFCAVCVFLLETTKHLFEWLRGIQHITKIAFDIEKFSAWVTLSRVTRLSLGQIQTQNSGFKIDIIKKGENAISDLFEALYFQLLPSAAQISIMLIGLACLNVWLCLIVTASVAGYVLMSMRINGKILPELRKQNKEGNVLSTFYWEIIKHLRLVMVHSQQERISREYADEYEEYSKAGKRMWLSYFRMITIGREPCAAFGKLAFMLCGIYLVETAKISPGKLVMALSWAMSGFTALGNVGSLQRQFARQLVFIGRYFDLLEMAPAVVAAANPIKPEKFTGRIEFKGVSFEYPVFERKNEIGLDEKVEEKTEGSEEAEESSPAIHDISFVIEPGTTCAFVGHSGAGKSSVINLLLRGYDPTQGQVLIDGIDLRELDIDCWRKAIGIVEQEPRLWDNTLGYNMTFGLNGEAGNVTPDELDVLARKTRIDEFYPRLGKKRFEAELGENGIQLSGGQRQRVAIARAIAKSPSLLILDEATNALDPQNEKLIHDAIREALVGRTGIIIAHRLSTIRHADQILFFEGGRVAGSGKHESLMQSCSGYRSLVDRELQTIIG